MLGAIGHVQDFGARTGPAIETPYGAACDDLPGLR